MTDGKLHRSAAPTAASWSNRVLLLSLTGIFFLTLYPFRFVHQESARFLFPFSLEGWGKSINALDIFLNILLFVPFGFGLAEKLRERGRSKASALLIVYASGAFVSYLVEFLQIYIPARDSGWLDVITNSSGGAVGALVFEVCGAGIVTWFSEHERRLDSWLNLTNIGTLVFLYMGFWTVLAGPLQRQTRLTNWTHDSFLAVGDVASLQPAPPWKGRILQLGIWNHAVPARLARKITAQSAADLRTSDPLSVFTFSGSAPFQDGRHFSPSLDWASAAPSPASGDGAVFDGRSWLISAGPVPTLVSSIETTGQFALHVVCQSAELAPSGSRVISLSSPTGAVNLELRQNGSALAFWFQNAFSKARARMTWVVPKVFAPDQVRNLLLSFDGSAVSLFVDGRDYGHAYQLGPGVALAHYIRRVKTMELPGYGYLFYTIIFVPTGCLLGFAWRNYSAPWIVRASFLVTGLVLPPLVFEWVLADAGRRGMSLQNVGFSVLLALAGSLWMNADRGFSRAPSGQRETVSVR